MQYLLMIYTNEGAFEKSNEAERAVMYQEYGKLIGEITQGGQYKGGNQLQPTRTATTVRVRNQKRLVTDGPFAESKEQLGGYFLIEAKDLDEAIAIAARIPSARDGAIEVRPIMPRQSS